MTRTPRRHPCSARHTHITGDEAPHQCTTAECSGPFHMLGRHCPYKEARGEHATREVSHTTLEASSYTSTITIWGGGGRGPGAARGRGRGGRPGGGGGRPGH